MTISNGVIRFDSSFLRDFYKKCSSSSCPTRREFEYVKLIERNLDDLGDQSAEAQGLQVAITSTARMISSSTVTCYMKFENGICYGFLKIGKKTLYVVPPSGTSLSCINPLCVLDFYVTKQRNGIGKELFDKMLSAEGVLPHELAYDRPSFKLLGFLKKHYALAEYVPQKINYVIFNEYFSLCQENHAKNSSTAEPIDIFDLMEVEKSSGVSLLSHQESISQSLISLLPDYRKKKLIFNYYRCLVFGLRKMGASMCMQYDCFGRALAMDHAFRQLTYALAELMNAAEETSKTPHTNAISQSTNNVLEALKELRPYTVSKVPDIFEKNVFCGDNDSTNSTISHS